MSWRDPNWKYEPAATHGDSQAFAQRQRERAEAAERKPVHINAVYGDSTYSNGVASLDLRQMREDWRPVRIPGAVYVWDVNVA